MVVLNNLKSPCTKRLLFLIHRQTNPHFLQRRHAQISSICELAKSYTDRLAIKDEHGQFTYDNLIKTSDKLTKVILDVLSSKTNTKNQTRIASLCPNNANYVIAQWATWKSGHVSVPLHHSYPSSLYEYYIKDSQSSLVITTRDLKPKLNDIKNVEILEIDDNSLFNPENSLNLSLNKHLFSTTPALILYTSGTTGPPKGVLLNHGNLSYMMDNMIEAWQWTKNDVILHTLPLHHTHGLVNALLCPLRVGACVVMMPRFDAEKVWSNLVAGDSKGKKVNLFMAVPTIYAKLLAEYEKKFSSSSRTKAFIKATCIQQIRLMVSGSASLPDSVFEEWKNITGHELLERYGMTEIGMALTNSLIGKRKPGFVGKPFPTVKVCITKPNVYSKSGYDIIVQSDANGTKVTPGMVNEEGELWVKGPSVFKEYWNKPEATAETFSKDNWFKTGDTAIYFEDSYKILGRTSVDIIKSGGYKISALDVERELLTHPKIEECVVVGVNDVTWGQRVAVVVMLKQKQILELDELKLWCLERMASHSVPTVLVVVESIQRNAMGKVNKKEIVKQYFPNQS